MFKHLNSNNWAKRQRPLIRSSFSWEFKILKNLQCAFQSNTKNKCVNMKNKTVICVIFQKEWKNIFNNFYIISTHLDVSTEQPCLNIKNTISKYIN